MIALLWICTQGWECNKTIIIYHFGGGAPLYIDGTAGRQALVFVMKVVNIMSNILMLRYVGYMVTLCPLILRLYACRA